MTNVRHDSQLNDIGLQHQINYHDPPIPLMSLTVRPTESPQIQSSSYQTSINKLIHSSSITPIPTNDNNDLSTSTFISRIDISKFYFAHVIKVPHGTDFVASDNQSTTVCINSIGNIIHLITPTGYHIQSSRWFETENKIIDLLW